MKKRLIAGILAACALASCLVLCACGDDDSPIELEGVTIQRVDGWDYTYRGKETSAHFINEELGKGYIEVYTDRNETMTAEEYAQEEMAEVGGQMKEETVTINGIEWIKLTPTYDNDNNSKVYITKPNLDDHMVRVAVVIFDEDEVMPIFNAMTLN